MKNKKIVFITIIVLLAIFVPLTIVGFITKGDRNLLDENPHHDLYYKGFIWFYDESDNLLSKYECLTEVCELTVPTIDDSTYGINYYKDGKVKNLSTINNRYAFITDGALIYLYNVSNGMTLESYKSLKNYHTVLENNVYILQKTDDLWGALSISGEVLSPVLPFNYDFVGLMNNISEDGILNTSKYIVLKDSKWYLVDNNNSAITGYIDDPIIEYTDKYVFSKNDERVRIYSYENYELLTSYKINNYILEDKYIGILTDNFLLIYEDLSTNYIKSVTITNTQGEITLEKVDNNLQVKVAGEVLESMAVS